MLLHSSLHTERHHEVTREGQDEAQSVSELEVELGATTEPDVEAVPFVDGKSGKDIK